jgi:hypothetical protein
VSVIGVILDKWAALSHKQPLSDSTDDRAVSQMNGWAPSNWTGEEHRRRLTAYMILQAYESNSSRHFLTTSDETDRAERREYGDAGLVVDQILAHLLGESQEVVVPGSEDYDPDLDEWEPGEPVEGEEPEQDPRTPEDIADNDEARALMERQAFLRDWADDVHLPLRLVDSERNAVKLGDGCLLLGWDARKRRVVPSIMEPGFYFPVLPDSLDSYDYPERVHFAWEYPGEDFPDGKQRVRRITYELKRIEPSYDEALLEFATTEEEFRAAERIPAGARYVTQQVPGEDFTIGRWERRYPWSEEPSDLMCVMTDAMWTLDDLKDASHPDAFRLENAEIRYTDDGVPIRDLDLLIDFIPVVHIPNLPPGGDHFGESSLSRVLQILDDLQNADTDAQAASATTGSPIIGLSGSATLGNDPLTGIRSPTREVRPGAVWPLGENGRMDALDTAPQLEATRDYVQHLLDRLSVNSRLPAAVLGRLKPSEVPSGFAMQLSFGPLTSMIRTMRLVRGVKYPLMMKMVQRIYQANGELPEGRTPRAEIQLGAYLPSDMQGVLTSVREAYGAKIISLETAVTMLLEVGFAIDDVAEEIQRIQSRDFEGANNLADATGDTDAVRAYLGMDPAAPEEPQAAPLVIQPGVVPNPNVPAAPAQPPVNA